MQSGWRARPGEELNDGATSAQAHALKKERERKRTPRPACNLGGDVVGSEGGLRKCGRASHTKRAIVPGGDDPSGVADDANEGVRLAAKVRVDDGAPGGVDVKAGDSAERRRFEARAPDGHLRFHRLAAREDNRPRFDRDHLCVLEKANPEAAERGADTCARWAGHRGADLAARDQCDTKIAAPIRQFARQFDPGCASADHDDGSAACASKPPAQGCGFVVRLARMGFMRTGHVTLRRDASGRDNELVERFGPARIEKDAPRTQIDSLGGPDPQTHTVAIDERSKGPASETAASHILMEAYTLDEPWARRGEHNFNCGFAALAREPIGKKDARITGADDDEPACHTSRTSPPGRP